MPRTTPTITHRTWGLHTDRGHTDLPAGACTQPTVHPDWWTSPDEPAQAVANHICQRHCHPQRRAHCRAQADTTPPTRLEHTTTAAVVYVSHGRVRADQVVSRWCPICRPDLIRAATRPPAPPADGLRSRQIADEWGIPIRVVQDAVAAGHLRGVRDGSGRWLVSAADAQAWVQGLGVAS